MQKSLLFYRIFCPFLQTSNKRIIVCILKYGWKSTYSENESISHEKVTNSENLSSDIRTFHRHATKLHNIFPLISAFIANIGVNLKRKTLWKYLNRVFHETLIYEYKIQEIFFLWKCDNLFIFLHFKIFYETFCFNTFYFLRKDERSIVRNVNIQTNEFQLKLNFPEIRGPNWVCW